MNTNIDDKTRNEFLELFVNEKYDHLLKEIKLKKSNLHANIF